MYLSAKGNQFCGHYGMFVNGVSTEDGKAAVDSFSVLELLVHKTEEVNKIQQVCYLVSETVFTN